MAEREKTPEQIAEERIQEALVRRATELDLSGLELTALPESIGELRDIQKLRLINNHLTALPESIGTLQELRGLYVWGNRLGHLPDSIGHLGMLQKLDVSRNGITALPGSIGQLGNLRGLYAQINKIREVPESIGHLGQLQYLYLSENELATLPESLWRLGLLKELYLHGNGKLGIPRELLGPRWENVRDRATPASPRVILDYYFRSRRESRALNEAKLILVGRGTVGKTCVVNRLVRDEFMDTSKTEGISITPWPIRLTGGEDVRLHVWDFGGQEIMHATHQFFLTQRSLYLLVLNGRQGGEDADAEYWLQLIESFGGDSPVIVVLNKIKEHPFDLNRRGLQGKYPAIRGFIKVDCRDRTGVDELRAVIEQETSALKDLRVPFPASWVAIKERLSGMAERGDNYLSFERYRELCAELGEKDLDAQEALAGYLHSLGIALNYKDDPRLHDTHVLSPHWVTNGIYKILNWPELEKQQGVLRFDDLATILDAKVYPKSKHLFLLDLMKKFEVCFEFPDDPQRRYLVPELFDKQEPGVTGEFIPKDCLNFEYHYNILPEGMLPRFIVRSHARSKGPERWRTGVVLELEGSRALVKADARDRKTFISVTGPAGARRRLLAVIRSDLERIHSDIRKLQVTEIVPVPGRPEEVVPYAKLKALEQSGRRKFTEVFGSDVVELDVQNLLNGVDIEGSRRREGELDRRTEAVRLFYSYSQKDETLRGELETHLTLLHRQGLISAWHDRKIAAGEEWKDQIDKNLEAAEIILLLISADFIASDYCYDKEMSRALERHEAGSVQVIPVVLRDVDWHPAPFGKFKPLPKDGTPVMLWPDRDTAWKDVALGIRKAAEACRQ